MNLVPDTNIFFSFMKPNSVASYLLFSLRVKFFSPEFAKSELNGHKHECLSKSGLSEHEFELRLEEIEEIIEVVGDSEYEMYLNEASKSIRDPDDAPYIAAALSLKASIWSNDPHLKQQSIVKVYTTRELIDKLLNDEL